MSLSASSGVDPLAQLRDIHQPIQPPWWPPAPGWWLGALLILLLLIVLVRWLHRRRRRRLPLLAAQRELRALYADYQRDGDRGRYLRALSALLRRAALVRFRADHIAGLSGDAWLAWLDKIVGGDAFSSGVGRVLADGPYAPVISDEQLDVDALHQLCQRWLKRLRAPS